MSGELDPKIAGKLSASAIGMLQPPRGDKNKDSELYLRGQG
jgi:hypothetical protein